MYKARVICIITLAVALALTATAPLAADGCEDGGCWRFRFGIARFDGEDEILTVFAQPDGSEERSKLGVTAGNGPAVSLEYLFNRRTGLEGSLCLTDLNALGVYDTNDDWDMTKKDLGVTSLAIGPNFHLTPGKSFDFYVGVFVALAMFDDVDYNLLGRSLRADLDDETGFGAQAGVDVPFGSSPWGFNVAARYMDVEPDVGGNDFPGTLSLSPIKLFAGLTWTSGGREPKPYCGDGKVDPGEECDDGNAADGDGCDSMCKVEPMCGDGNVDPGEECDDGNTRSGDGCSSSCRKEPMCGDGKVDPGEECDDGNRANGDGCSASCRKEPPPERRETCQFEYGSYRVDNICKARLDEIGLSMVQDPNLIATVIGHSDGRGSDKGNLQASERRAGAVKKYLIERYGIDESRITVEGRGSAEPVASNDTVDGRQRNRRAEIVVKSR